MKRNKFTLCLFTDSDFYFENELMENYRDYELKAFPVYCFSFEFYDNKVEGIVEFLNSLKKSVRSSTHDWIVSELEDMIDPAIEFLKSDQKGIFHSTLKDGNWQPSDLYIMKE